MRVKRNKKSMKLPFCPLSPAPALLSPDFPGKLFFSPFLGNPPQSAPQSLLRYRPEPCLSAASRPQTTSTLGFEAKNIQI